MTTRDEYAPLQRPCNPPRSRRLDPRGDGVSQRELPVGVVRCARSGASESELATGTVDRRVHLGSTCWLQARSGLGALLPRVQFGLRSPNVDAVLLGPGPAAVDRVLSAGSCRSEDERSRWAVATRVICNTRCSRPGTTSTRRGWLESGPLVSAGVRVGPQSQSMPAFRRKRTRSPSESFDARAARAILAPDQTVAICNAAVIWSRGVIRCRHIRRARSVACRSTADYGPQQ